MGVVVATVALLALAACSSGGTGSSSAATNAPAASAAAPKAGGAYGSDGGSSTTSAAGTATTSLATATSGLGTIVVDGSGMTVYQFDKDTQGATTSACTGQCATLWPAVHAGSSMPTVNGVTGTVGTITGTDGQPQLTLNGWPLYHYSGDSAAGDTKGQGVLGIWWVLTPAGQRITG